MLFLNSKKKDKGFTLIELLVVVSIISFLSSVVLASLNTARTKSKDALLRTEALQLRTLLELEYSETGSYIGLNPNNLWISTSADCDNVTVSGNYATQARNICKIIVANASVSWYAAKFYLGTFGSLPNKFSIMIALPSKNTFLCVGSSGSITDTQATSLWDASGCWANP